MSEEKSNLDEREDEDIFDEPKTLNDSEGDQSEDTSALDEYNRRTGKNFKSWDDVVKSTKEADKLFSKGIHKEQPKVVDDVSELFFTTTPQAELVKDDLEKVSKLHGGSILKAWREEKWLQEKATLLSKEREEERENLSKIGRPSPGKSASMNFSQVDLSNPEHVKWLNSKEGRRKEYLGWYASK
jgi:hypothetical protein